ncbi:hypothetical protein MRX96_046203 [Rhipicephalus microplus]
MVRGSLDLGIHVVLSIEFGEKDFLNKKRVIKAYKILHPTEIPGYMVGVIKKMVSTIRSTYKKAFESSTWIGRSIREAAVRKLNNITSYVGSPGNRLDPKYVEEVYSEY